MHEIFKATVKTLSHEGRGVASIDGKTVFIEGALPEEVVSFKYSKRHRKFDEGQLVEVLEGSENRIEPLCPHFAQCGGCSLQHMSATAQILFKQQVLLEQLEHFGNVKPNRLLAPIMGPSYQYRTRARLGVKYVEKKGKMLVGFREKDPRYLADLEHCSILHPKIGNLLEPLKKVISQLSVFQSVPQIEVAIGDKEGVLVFRHLKSFTEADKKILEQFGRENELAIYLQPEGISSIHPLLSLEEGTLSYHLPDFELNFKFRPTDFTQINTEINKKMVKLAIELLELNSNDCVLDLFCGLGNFTLPIATLVSKVIGVEGSEEMVKQARLNASLNNITNTIFYAHDLQSMNEPLWAKDAYNKVLLDPPRAGALECLPTFAKMDIKRIVYVSCNPATLARDIGECVKKYGYTLEAVGVLDMFPQTSHVESMALLIKDKA